MLVSVVIPAYNSEEWISESIASVLVQTHRNLEIILVDDGSTDRTVEVAETVLQGGRIPFRILRQANRGAAGARNRGWQVAQGGWVQFLDSDDLLAPEKIEVQVERALGTEGGDVVYTNWQTLVWRDGAWRRHDLRTPVIQSDALADVLSDRNFLQLSSLLFKAGTLETAGGFDQSHEPIEDVGLCVKVAIAGGKFIKAQSNGPMSWYRDVPRSFSKRNHRRFIESCIKNAKLAEQYAVKDPTCSPRIVDTIVDVYYFGARYFAGYDWNRFEEIVTDIEALRPSFVPKAPTQLNVLSRITGYRRAERVAALYRKGKRIGAGLWKAREVPREI